MEKLIAQNKKARHEFELDDELEAGMALVGSEVKSLRAGKASLDAAWVQVRGDELFLVGCHIPEYPWANRFNHEPMRERKLLVHRAEIEKMAVRVKERGYTIIPLRLYWKDSRVKVELGLGKGKKLHDKREDLRAKDAKREMDRALKAWR